VLLQRHILKDSLDCLDKYKLVELFYKYVVPLPQRIYGSGRRERRLSKIRNSKEGMKRPIDASTSNKDDRQQKRPCNQTNAGDRLKPPPSKKNGENKFVKLSKCSTKSSDTDSNRKFTNAEKELGKEHNSDIRSNSSKHDTAFSESKSADGVSPSKKSKFQTIYWP